MHIGSCWKKYSTEDRLKIEILQKPKTQHRKSKQHKTQQNHTSLVQSLLTTLGQETRWIYSIMLLHPQAPHDISCRTTRQHCMDVCQLIRRQSCFEPVRTKYNLTPGCLHDLDQTLQSPVSMPTCFVMAIS